MNKRGSILDSIIIILVIVAVAITGLLTVAFTKTIGNAFDESEDIPDYAKELSNSVTNQTPGIIDFIAVILIIGLPLISMALAFFVDTHPIIFWASLGLIILILILAGGFSVAWGSLTDNNLFGEAAYDMPMTNWIMNHYVIYALFVVGLIIFGTFVKARSGGYYG